MLIIDGSKGEGGGQMLRSSLSLSAITGQPFEMINIRSKRNKPGLLRQHLTGLRAAATVCNAEVSGDELGSGRITFRPRSIYPGEYVFSVGSAGSAVLVLQTVIPILMSLDSACTVVVNGGTHNEKAPPFEYLDHVFLPILSRLSVQCEAKLIKHGFFPTGGGCIMVTINPSSRKPGLALTERGPVTKVQATAILSRIPDHVAMRELTICEDRLRIRGDALLHRRVKNADCAGNVLLVDVFADHIQECFVGFGRRGVSAEKVAEQTVDAVQTYLDSEVPVGEYLADQLMLPLLLRGGGVYRTGPLSLHATTNAEIIGQFTGTPPRMKCKGDMTTVTIDP